MINGLETPEQLIKRLKRQNAVTFGGLLIVFTLRLFTFLMLYSLYPQKYETQIHYDDLSPKEIARVKHMMQYVKPLYLQYSRSITFTHNITRACGKYCSGLQAGEYAGINPNPSHNIFIQYSIWDDDLKNRICHELLHSVVFPPETNHNDNNLHGIVYDLAGQDVCFYSNME